ncbi:MAG: penicillin acylase family protein, partial [Pseudomonadota bacterium]
FYGKLRASLPRIDGAASLTGLGAAVTVTRDAQGVPTLHGASRLDLARALGYLHAQDRFFQMDTLRRHAAGELSEIVGKAALPLDQAARIHGFRLLARRVLERLAPGQRDLLDAYAGGVNAGLAALHAKPFEYYLLRTEPQPWRPEDSVLMIYAMTLDLQDGAVRYERSLTALRDRLGVVAVAFFAPLVTPDDAALDGSSAPAAAIPGPGLIDLRKTGSATPSVARAERAGFTAGSSSFALAGARTATGAALLANDMHLDLRVPNTWYRASLEWDGHKVTGVTLPGAPNIVAGSNGSIAWGFTNACADIADLVTIQVSVYDHTKYSSTDGKQAPFEVRRAKILVKGGDPVEVETTWTEWGPIVGADEKTRPLALRWVAHDLDAANYTLVDLETAADVDQAIAVAHRSGIPAQNFLVAGADGRIAWTIAGRLPNRFGYDGRFPVPWYFGDRGWHGLLPPDEVPVIRGDGQLWTANNRVAGGAALAALGDGGYDRPARATQIRDDLSALSKAAPKDLLAVQLDDRAVFLARWQKLLLATLTPEVIAQKKSRAELRALVEKWEGHASIDSVSYRL